MKGKTVRFSGLFLYLILNDFSHFPTISTLTNGNMVFGRGKWVSSGCRIFRKTFICIKNFSTSKKITIFSKFDVSIPAPNFNTSWNHISVELVSFGISQFASYDPKENFSRLCPGYIFYHCYLKLISKVVNCIIKRVQNLSKIFLSDR